MQRIFRRYFLVLWSPMEIQCWRQTPTHRLTSVPCRALFLAAPSSRDLWSRFAIQSRAFSGCVWHLLLLLWQVTLLMSPNEDGCSRSAATCFAFTQCSFIYDISRECTLFLFAFLNKIPVYRNWEIVCHRCGIHPNLQSHSTTCLFFNFVYCF